MDKNMLGHVFYFLKAAIFAYIFFATEMDADFVLF